MKNLFLFAAVFGFGLSTSASAEFVDVREQITEFQRRAREQEARARIAAEQRQSRARAAEEAKQRGEPFASIRLMDEEWLQIKEKMRSAKPTAREIQWPDDGRDHSRYPKRELIYELINHAPSTAYGRCPSGLVRQNRLTEILLVELGGGPTGQGYDDFTLDVGCVDPKTSAGMSDAGGWGPGDRDRLNADIGWDGEVTGVHVWSESLGTSTHGDLDERVISDALRTFLDAPLALP